MRSVIIGLLAVWLMGGLVAAGGCQPSPGRTSLEPGTVEVSATSVGVDGPDARAGIYLGAYHQGDGHATFRLAPGQYTVRAELEGEEQEQQVTVESGGEHRVEFAF